MQYLHINPYFHQKYQHTMQKTLALLALVCSLTPSFAQNLSLQPMYNSIGVKVSLDNIYDTDETGHCYLQYRKSGTNDWLDGFDADRVRVQGGSQFRGSLMLLEENTAYYVRVRLLDSIPAISSYTFPDYYIATLPSPSFNPGNNVKWVAPNGSGTAYTEAQPGNIKALLASGAVGCGSTVMIKDGLYADFNMALTIQTDCSENNPIQFLAAPGAQPVFDGGHSAPLVWTQHVNDPKLYTAALPSGTDFTNLCLLNGQILYPYPTTTAEILFGNYNLLSLNLETDGFTRDGSIIRIKTEAGTDPNAATVVLSKAFRFLTVYGNIKNAHLKFQGITVKNIAKSNINGFDAYTGIAFDMRNVNQVQFDRCTLENNNSNISFSGYCRDILVQHCRIAHQSGMWSHAMIKKSNDFSAFFPTTMGRGSETGAILFTEGSNITIRNNQFAGTGSGVVGSFETALMEEVDINDNVISDNFDAIECDGNWCNLRVWNNEIVRPMAGFSIAPPMIGPRYFYRNTVHHMQGRHNEQDDPYFIECAPPTAYRSQGIGIKTNSGSGPGGANASNLYFFNNTFFSDDSLGFSYTLWEGEWKNTYFVNNIFVSANKHLGYFQGFLNKNTFQLSSEHDNYFSENAAAPLFVIKEIHGQYTCHDVFAVTDIETQLRSITGSNKISFSTPFQLNPQFSSTDVGGFELAATSPMINKGVLIKGFYDYKGNLPDLGAKESAIVSSVGQISLVKSISVFPNPTKGSVQVDFGEAVPLATVMVYNAMGQLVSQYSLENERLLPLELPKVAGVYLLKVWVNGENSIFKIVHE